MNSERKHDLCVNGDILCVVVVILIYVNDAGKQAYHLINRFGPF